MFDLLQDFRFAARILRKRPGASLVIVLTLALGIGVNSTFFSNFSAMALRPLPFDQPDQLVQIHRSEPAAGRKLIGVADGTFLDWRENQNVFSTIGAFTFESFNLHAADLPERVEGARISAELFPSLGITPAQGRLFTADEDLPGGARVALISQSLWQRSLGGDPEVLGRTLDIDGESHVVVGVMAEKFAFPLWQELWIPLGLDPRQADRGAGRLQVLGRLAEGVDLATAQSTMEGLSLEETQTYEEVPDGMSVALLRLHEAWMPPVTQIAGIVMQGLVTLVLLIVCTNVANMVLAQATTRRQELALRAALGADRRRLVRQALVESTLLALLGGGLGLLIAAWQGDWVERISSVPIPYWLSFEFEQPIFVFTLLITLGVGLVVGLLPGLGGNFDALAESLKSGGRSDSGTPGGRTRRILVVAEYAMAVVILVGALLMVRAYQHVADADQGFAVAQTTTLSLALTGQSFARFQTGLDFVERSLDELSTVPGVRSVAAVSSLPISRGGYKSAQVEAQGLAFEEEERPRVTVQAVSQDYFQTLEIPTDHGRTFHLADLRQAAPVTVINKRFADQLWPGEDPLGRQVRIDSEGPWLTIVGTVGDVRAAESIAGIDTQPKNQLYLPLGYTTSDSYEYLTRTPSLVISSSTSAENLGPALRTKLAEIDSRVAVFSLQPMKKHLEQHYFAQLIWSRMFSLIGLVALLIAALGAYGVSAFSVSRRTREMGIRLALGEAPGGLMTRVVFQGLKLAALGLGIGLLAALPLANAMHSLLHGVGAGDPLVVGGVVFLLLLVAVAATFFPARRAAAVDPIRALRQD